MIKEILLNPFKILINSVPLGGNADYFAKEVMFMMIFIFLYPFVCFLSTLGFIFQASSFLDLTFIIIKQILIFAIPTYTALYYIKISLNKKVTKGQLAFAKKVYKLTKETSNSGFYVLKEPNENITKKDLKNYYEFAFQNTKQNAVS